MIKFRILASVIPLIALTGIAGSWAGSAPQPCIATPSGSVVLSSMAWYAPWHSGVHIGFTDNPAEATLRVELVASPDLADFVVADDPAQSDPDATAETDACRAAPARFVTIDRTPAPGETVIYLTSETGLDPAYRIYVNSTTFTAREAAAMIVAAHHNRKTAAL